MDRAYVADRFTFLGMFQPGDGAVFPGRGLKLQPDLAQLRTKVIVHEPKEGAHAAPDEKNGLH